MRRRDGPSVGAAIRRALRGAGARVALGVLIVFTVCAIGGENITPYNPKSQPDPERMKNMPPSLAHPFGTDYTSRDVLSRVIQGAQVSLGVAGAAVLLSVTLGTGIGAAAGFFGGWTDVACMRIVDALLSIPRLLLLIVLVATTGAPSLGGIILILGATSWPGMSRLVRAEVRSLKERDYVKAARATGVPETQILLQHVLPGVLPQVLVAGTLAFASVIPLEAGLSYLGLGVAKPRASWGNIIQDGVDPMHEAWWTVVFPGLAIVATVLAVNTIGERLREAVDPRQLPPR
jgi:peptide/nickel transport system permease protein